MQNTRLDKEYYLNTDPSKKCTVCQNHPVATIAGLFCIRCNINLPDELVK